MATFTLLLEILADVPDPRRAEGKIYKLLRVFLKDRTEQAGDPCFFGHDFP